MKVNHTGMHRGVLIMIMISLVTAPAAADDDIINQFFDPDGLVAELFEEAKSLVDSITRQVTGEILPPGMSGVPVVEPGTSRILPSQGSPGGSCWEDTSCSSGECIGGVCIPCGLRGQPACTRFSPPCESSCQVVNGYCLEESMDCGLIGTRPCPEGLPCHYGVYDAGAGICMDCGDYYQPCCPDTEFDCDYGKCINGICRPVTAATPTPRRTGVSPSRETATPAEETSENRHVTSWAPTY